MKNISPPNLILFDRYLKILGLDRRKPSHKALTELVTAHLNRIPFENISKLYYLKCYDLRSIPDFELYLDGLERYHFGGTCYSNNYYLHLLLEHLGYEVKLCGADMTNPDVHIVNIVTLAGREFLIDVGYGAPFLTPLPRDLTRDFELSLGRDRYVLKPQDERGYSRIEQYHDGTLRHFYTVKPTPRRISFFDNVFTRSFRPEATFMNALLLVRFHSERSLMIFNLSLIKSRRLDSHSETIPHRENLPEVIEEHFDIPRAISAEALTMLREMNTAWD